jgi:hypothetical protein
MNILNIVLLFTLAVVACTIVHFTVARDGMKFETSTNASNELQAYYAAKQASNKFYVDSVQYDYLLQAIENTILHIECLSKWHNDSRVDELVQLRVKLVFLNKRIDAVKYVKSI